MTESTDPESNSQPNSLGTQHVTGPAGTPVPDPSQAESPFGSDDLGRIQGILLGDHAKKTAERIDTLESALLGAISDLRTDIENQLATLEARLDAEANTRTKGINNLTDRLREESRTRSSDDALLRNDLEEGSQRLSANLETAKLRAIDELRLARAEFAEKLEARTQTIKSEAVDRKDLADLFTATADKLKGS